MKRRSFIKNSCISCMSIAMGSTLLKSCAAKGIQVYKTSVTGNLLQVSLTKMDAAGNFLLVRSPSMENDILLTKKNNVYSAVLMRCTHEGIALTATKNKLICAAHGSVFDFDGNVLTEPALTALKKFKTSIEKENIIIHLT